MTVNATDVLVWVQVGGEMLRIGLSSIAHVRDAMAAGTIEADQATLARLEGLYDERIARAEAAAGETQPPY
jgi:hypothetical protein